MTTKLDVAELKRLVEKATPGPWIMETVPTSVGRAHKVGPSIACIYEDHRYVQDKRETDKSSDAALIAYLGTHAPSIVAALEELADTERRRHEIQCICDQMMMDINVLASERDAQAEELAELRKDRERLATLVHEWEKRGEDYGSKFGGYPEASADYSARRDVFDHCAEAVREIIDSARTALEGE